jgi:hypothetical protein
MLEDAISAIQDVETGVVTARPFKDILSGFSGSKIVALLQSLTALLTPPAECYLEIGVFRGLTLLATAVANPLVACFGIEMKICRGSMLGEIIAWWYRRTSVRKIQAENVELIVGDFEQALSRLAPGRLLGKRIGVYFIDGAYDYRSQLLCLMLARPILRENSLIVVHDCNYPHVRQANADFLAAEPIFKLLFEAYTHCHLANMDAPEAAQARQGWWNGLNVLVGDPENRLPRVMPVVHRSELPAAHLVYPINCY